MYDPFSTTRPQRILLWSVADAAKTYVSFLHRYRTRGQGKHQVESSFMDLCKQLDLLDASKPDSDAESSLLITVSYGSVRQTHTLPIRSTLEKYFELPESYDETLIRSLIEPRKYDSGTLVTCTDNHVLVPWWAEFKTTPVYKAWLEEATLGAVFVELNVMMNYRTQ